MNRLYNIRQYRASDASPGASYYPSRVRADIAGHSVPPGAVNASDIDCGASDTSTIVLTGTPQSWGVSKRAERTPGAVAVSGIYGRELVGAKRKVGLSSRVIRHSWRSCLPLPVSPGQTHLALF